MNRDAVPRPWISFGANSMARSLAERSAMGPSKMMRSRHYVVVLQVPQLFVWLGSSYDRRFEYERLAAACSSSWCTCNSFVNCSSAPILTPVPRAPFPVERLAVGSSTKSTWFESRAQNIEGVL